MVGDERGRKEARGAAAVTLPAEVWLLQPALRALSLAAPGRPRLGFRFEDAGVLAGHLDAGGCRITAGVSSRAVIHLDAPAAAPLPSAGAPFEVLMGSRVVGLGRVHPDW